MHCVPTHVSMSMIDAHRILVSFDVNQVHSIALIVNCLNYVMDRPGKV
jgi:hypothetical protein